MILVTGATGNVGRQLVLQLLAAGRATRALSRAPEQAQLPSAVDVFGGDLVSPASAAAAFAGVEAVFLFAVPRATAPIVELARGAGVRRIVLLSSGAVGDGVGQQADPIAAYHAEAEQVVRASGLAWCILRPSSFAANALQWAGQIRAAGVVQAPFGEATAAPIHEGDIAAVAVAALTQERYLGQTLALTGPQSLTTREQVHILGEGIGRPLRFEELPPEVARAEMQTHVPASIVDALMTIWAESVGRPALVLPTVTEVTGRPARTFEAWAREHRADFG